MRTITRLTEYTFAKMQLKQGSSQNPRITISVPQTVNSNWMASQCHSAAKAAETFFGELAARLKPCPDYACLTSGTEISRGRPLSHKYLYTELARVKSAQSAA